MKDKAKCEEWIPKSICIKNWEEESQYFPLNLHRSIIDEKCIFFYEKYLIPICLPITQLFFNKARVLIYNFGSMNQIVDTRQVDSRKGKVNPISQFYGNLATLRWNCYPIMSHWNFFNRKKMFNKTRRGANLTF